MRKKSLVRGIVHYLVVLIVLLVLLLAGYAASSYAILSNELRNEADNILKVYGGQLKSRINQMDVVLQNLLVQNQAKFQLLKSTSESKRFYALQDIHNYIRDTVQSDASVSALVVADTAYSLCVDAGAASVTYWDRVAMQAFTTESASKDDVPKTWQFVTLNQRVFLCKLYVYNGRAAAAFISAQDFLATVPHSAERGQALLLLDAAGSLAAYAGDDALATAPTMTTPTLFTPGAQFVDYPLVAGHVSLRLVLQSVFVWSQTRILMAVMLAVIVITLCFGALIVRYARREMVHPMNRMVEDMRRIDGGEYSLRMQGEYGTQEFTQLKDTFNRLMDVVVHLRIQSYEKRIELRDMELRSIRLQLRPHFFLNAITTISSLSTQGKAQELKIYVDALSKNIRYMFKSGLHTVPVGEEIRHVENYFAMQECKYPGCIFQFIDLPAELETWRVPQMLVQTFVENEYKYAVSMDELLTILIRVSLETYQGEEMLLIRIEDDGKGYPQDVLDYMNGNAPRPANDGERVGLWSIKRMLALMYARDDLLQLDNLEPHGCVNLIHVPAAPLHEYHERNPVHRMD